MLKKSHLELTGSEMNAPVITQRFVSCRLYAPALGATGKHCVRFNYHMYGFHIYKLQLVKKSMGGDVTELWFRTKDLGRRWWDAAVTVDIKSTDRVSDSKLSHCLVKNLFNHNFSNVLTERFGHLR